MKQNILLIDDNPAYCADFESQAHKQLFDVHLAHNLKQGIELLMHNRQIGAVVLDGHCFIEPGQPGNPGVNFVFHALHSLDDLEREQNRLIPRCVNTEQPEEFRDELKGLVQVFSKTGDPAFLFRWLRKTIAQLPEWQIKEEHASIFDDASLVFDDHEIAELIDLIAFSHNPDLSDIPNRLSVIRRLLEQLADACAIRLLKNNPADMAGNMGVSVKPIFDAMRSKKIVPGTIQKEVTRLYSYCSEYGTHIYRQQLPVYDPGIYSYRRSLNSFLEITEYCLRLMR
jgi:hypothetical protein